MTSKPAANDRAFRAAWAVAAIVVFLLVVAIRVRLLAIPLERDEGEYAYAGQLMLEGVPPYKLAYNMKFPGTYAAYAIVMAIFGQTTTAIHLGLLLVNAATVWLIFLLGRRLINWIAGIAAAMSYAILSVTPSVLGFAAHASHFVMLPVLGGILLLLEPVAAVYDRRKSIDNRSTGALQKSVPAALIEHHYSRIFVSGCLFGLGLLMKQPAIFFILFGGIYLMISGLQLRRAHKLQTYVPTLVFGGGVLIPFSITCLLLWHAGVFDKFWFWTISYARQYAAMVPPRLAPKLFIDACTPVLHAGWLVWTLAGVGLIAALWDRRTRSATLFVFGFFVSSFLTFSAGFYFREHYFIFLLPAVSLFAGIAANMLCDLAGRWGSVARLAQALLFLIVLSQPVVAARKLYVEGSSVEACRIAYGPNPFPESVRIAEYLRDHSGPDDTIAVLGSEPQIYFYSKRHSATGYIYTYALMESQSYAPQMQQEMIREIETARPKYLISVDIAASWLRQPTSDGAIFDWANEYIKQFYDLVGFINIVSRDHTEYYFDELPDPMPQELENCLLIFRRKS